MKDLSYQPDQSQQLNQSQQTDQLMLLTWEKVTKSRFNEIRSMITKGKKSGLVTPIGKKRITLSDTTMFVEGLISR